MFAASRVAVTGLQAASAVLAVSAHNVANQQTPAFRRQAAVQTEAPGGGVEAGVEQLPEGVGSLESDLVGQLAAKHDFLANLAVFRSSDRMAGSLLDLRA